MNTFHKCFAVLMLAALTTCPLFAQTDGEATMEVTIRDYTGTSGTKHWTVAWVTTESGAFIKTLRRQGPTVTSSHWNQHCGAWYNAKSNNSIDGYTSATANDYAGTNSPVILTWDCRDANNDLVADGDYKFWVQYAEDKGQGPYTTSGLLWTKGPVSATKTFPNQGSNFADMRVNWTAVIAETPRFSSVLFENGSLRISGTGPGNRPFRLLSSDDLSLPIDQWSLVASNFFGADGAFTLSKIVNSGVARRFYRLQSP